MQWEQEYLTHSLCHTHSSSSDTCFCEGEREREIKPGFVKESVWCSSVSSSSSSSSYVTETSSRKTICCEPLLLSREKKKRKKEMNNTIPGEEDESWWTLFCLSWKKRLRKRRVGRQQQQISSLTSRLFSHSIPVDVKSKQPLPSSVYHSICHSFVFVCQLFLLHPLLLPPPPSHLSIISATLLPTTTTCKGERDSLMLSHRICHCLSSSFILPLVSHPPRSHTLVWSLLYQQQTWQPDLCPKSWIPEEDDLTHPWMLIERPLRRIKSQASRKPSPTKRVQSNRNTSEVSYMFTPPFLFMLYFPFERETWIEKKQQPRRRQRQQQYIGILVVDSLLNDSLLLCGTLFFLPVIEWDPLLFHFLSSFCAHV